MPTNRKRLVVPISMGAGGFEVLKTRDDVEVIPFPPRTSPHDARARRRGDGEATGAFLGLPRSGETGAKTARGRGGASRIGVVYDTGGGPAPTRHKVPLMVAG